MNKYLKIIFVLLIVVLLVVAAFVGGGKSAYKSITFEEYKSVKGNYVVYVGDDSVVMDNIKELSIPKDYEVSYLDYSKLSDKQKDKVVSESIEIYKDGKKESVYEFDRFKRNEGDKKSEIKSVSKDEYLKLIKADGFNFVYVGRETCHYCELYKESFDKVFEDYKLDINYLDMEKLEDNEWEEIAKTDDVFNSEEFGTPTSLVYYNGQKMDVIVGYKDEKGLIELIKKYELKLFLMDNMVI